MQVAWSTDPLDYSIIAASSYQPLLQMQECDTLLSALSEHGVGVNAPLRCASGVKKWEGQGPTGRVPLASERRRDRWLAAKLGRPGTPK